MPATLDEETVRHSHDVGLVNGRHSLPPVGLGVLESELGHPEKKLGILESFDTLEFLEFC